MKREFAKNKYVVGLTGGIGTGKSTVAAVLMIRGFKVVDADRIAREVLKSGSAVVVDIRKAFSDDVFNNGSLDRVKMAKIVFSDPEKRKEYEDIIHPVIIFEMWKQIAEAEESVVIAVIPLLFETGLNEYCDLVVSVIADEKVVMKRILERDKLDESEIRQRIDAQTSQHERIKKSDFVIDNSGELDKLFDQINELVFLIRKRGEA